MRTILAATVCFLAVACGGGGGECAPIAGSYTVHMRLKQARAGSCPQELESWVDVSMMRRGQVAAIDEGGCGASVTIDSTGEHSTYELQSSGDDITGEVDVSLTNAWGVTRCDAVYLATFEAH